MTEQLYRKNEDGDLEEVEPSEPSDTLYRRNQDGMMESVVPEAQGKAAAHDRLMAQGGKTNKQGKFTQGRLKGLTYDQAKQKFESMWASAPEHLKEGYAEHARSGATASEKKVASERRVASIQPTPATARPALSPQQSRMKMYEDQKVSRIRQTGGEAGVEAYKRRTAAQPAQSPGNSFAELTKQPATPAGGAQSVGDGSSAANGYTPQPRTVYNMQTGQQDPVVMSATPAMSPAQMDAADTKRALDQYAASPLAMPAKLSLGQAVASDVSSYASGINNLSGKVAQAITTPARIIQNNIPGQIGNYVRDQNPAGALQNGAQAVLGGAASSAVMQMAGRPIAPPLSPSPSMAATPSPPQPGGFNPAIEKAFPGIQGPVPSSPTTPPPQARPFVGPPAPQMSANPAPGGRLNSLTGLPMGYRSGDSVSSQYQGKADESVARQKSAQDAAIASAPRAVPVASPNALADRHTAAVASYKQDLDPAKAVKADAIYSGGTDQQKAQMAANTLKRAAGVTSATRPQYAATRATPPPQPRRSLMPGLPIPRFAMAR